MNTEHGSFYNILCSVWHIIIWCEQMMVTKESQLDVLSLWWLMTSPNFGVFWIIFIPL